VVGIGDDLGVMLCIIVTEDQTTVMGHILISVGDALGALRDINVFTKVQSASISQENISPQIALHTTATFRVHRPLAHDGTVVKLRLN